MDVVVGALLFIAALAAIVILRRRARRLDPVQNLNECQAEFDAAEHDLTKALSLLEQAEDEKLTWAEACRQLGGWAQSPAASLLVDTPDGDEPAAQDLFETAVAKLGEVHTKAGENLEMAKSLVDDENEEV